MRLHFFIGAQIAQAAWLSNIGSLGSSKEIPPEGVMHMEGYYISGYVSLFMHHNELIVNQLSV